MQHPVVMWYSMCLNHSATTTPKFTLVIVLYKFPRHIRLIWCLFFFVSTNQCKAKRFEARRLTPNET